MTAKSNDDIPRVKPAHYHAFVYEAKTAGPVDGVIATSKSGDCISLQPSGMVTVSLSGAMFTPMQYSLADFIVAHAPVLSMKQSKDAIARLECTDGPMRFEMHSAAMPVTIVSRLKDGSINATLHREYPNTRTRVETYPNQSVFIDAYTFDTQQPVTTCIMPLGCAIEALPRIEQAIQRQLENREIKRSRFSVHEGSRNGNYYTINVYSDRGIVVHPIKDDTRVESFKTVQEYKEHYGLAPSAIAPKTLFERIEAYGFECEAGLLSGCAEWQELKATPPITALAGVMGFHGGKWIDGDTTTALIEHVTGKQWNPETATSIAAIGEMKVRELVAMLKEQGAI